MTVELQLQPPHWPKTILSLILTDDPMRDAIFGDLHEEFAFDAGRIGTARARARYLMRAAGIAAFAAADFMCLRGWASSSPPYSSFASAPTPAPAVAGRRSTGRFADFAILLLTFAILVGAIVANTLLFSAARERAAAGDQRGAAAITTVAVVLLVVSAVFGAVLLCAGPRWLRRRRAKDIDSNPTTHS